jgi:transcription initiation factor TFIIH subunit 4
MASIAASKPSTAKASGTRKKQRATTGVLDYLQTALPRADLLDLYTEETRGRFVCRAVLQQLTEVSQQIVVRLSCTGGTFPAAGVKVWAQPGKFEKSVKELHRWAIIDQDVATGGTVTLTPQFAQGLQESLCSLDSSPWTAVSPKQIQMMELESKEKPVVVTPEDLERYTQTQWDTVLHFLVGTVGQADPPPAVVHFLLQTGLMQADPDFTGDEEEAPLVITENGYDYMLESNTLQVWHFVVEYLRSLESHEKGRVLRKEALLLLICLSFARTGEAYLASGLHKNGRVMVKDLALFGLLYTRKIGKSTLFYPTRIAMQLVGAQEDGADTNAVWSLSSAALESALTHPRPQDSSHLAIIVQTNFQVAAYTTSELHVSMLGLFCDVQTIRRLPNVVFMSITRDSVKAAFALGIQARQILRFLQKHIHPRMRMSASPIPSNGELIPYCCNMFWLYPKATYSNAMILISYPCCNSFLCLCILTHSPYLFLTHQSRGSGLVVGS